MEQTFHQRLLCCHTLAGTNLRCCRWEKTPCRHQNPKNHSACPGKESLSSFPDRLLLLHQDTNTDIGAAAKHTHITLIKTAEHGQTADQAKSDAELFLLYNTFCKNQDRREIYYRTSQCIMLSPHHHVAVECIDHGSNQLGLLTEIKF